MPLKNIQSLNEEEQKNCMKFGKTGLHGIIDKIILLNYSDFLSAWSSSCLVQPILYI